MDSSTLGYQLLAQGFASFLNVMMVITLVLNYLSSRKPFLIIAGLAGLIEACRLIPNLLLVIYSGSTSMVLVSLAVQFIATFVYVLALVNLFGISAQTARWLVGVPLAAFVLSLSLLATLDFPDTRQAWYLHSLPLLALTLLVPWLVWQQRHPVRAGQLFLLMVALALSCLRAIIPVVSLGELFYLLYYMETLLFPLLLAALNVLEVESANTRIKNLLDEQERAREDLQFILDNSLDVILTADHVGLLQSWNKRAEQWFGYNDEQTIGKMHMDELFADHFLEQRINKQEEFRSRVEHLEGGIVEVAVRTRTVVQDNSLYRVFVLRELKGEGPGPFTQSLQKATS